LSDDETDLEFGMLVALAADAEEAAPRPGSQPLSGLGRFSDLDPVLRLLDRTREITRE
jgi:hypothetical protein